MADDIESHQQPLRAQFPQGGCSIHHLIARRKLGIISAPLFNLCVRKFLPQKIARLLKTGGEGAAFHAILAIELSDDKLAVRHHAQDGNPKPRAGAKSSN